MSPEMIVRPAHRRHPFDQVVKGRAVIVREGNKPSSMTRVDRSIFQIVEPEAAAFRTP